MIWIKFYSIYAIILRFFRETEPPGQIDKREFIMEIYMGTYYVKTEAKKSHHTPCASWRTRKAGGVIQSESDGLRTRGVDITFSLRPKAWKPGVGASGVSPGVWRPRTWSLDVQEQEKMMSQLQKRDWIHLVSAFLFYMGPQWIRWCLPTLVRRDLPYSVHWFNCQSLPGIPSQTYPKLMLYQLSGYPLTQSNWYLKLTITDNKECINYMELID